MEKSSFKLALLLTILLVFASYAQKGAKARNVVSLRCHEDRDCSCPKCTSCSCRDTWCACPGDLVPPAAPAFLSEILSGYRTAKHKPEH
ncbi:hypothetical protein ACFX19_040899 [Malus domestica]